MNMSINEESGQVEIFYESLREIFPSPENDRLYKPIDRSDPELIELAKNIRERGVLSPLVVTLDGYILSGHRRYAAAIMAGLETVPITVEPICRTDDIDAFVRLLRDHNRQRVKSLDEQIREAAIDIDPDRAYRRLQVERRERAVVEVQEIALTGTTRRAAISNAKGPFLSAVVRILRDLRPYWPVSDRQIHYQLLNDPPLRHASKPGSTYKNNRQCYGDLCDLLTRARLTGQIPHRAISDDTRPVVQWDVHREPAPYIREQLSQFLTGYWRDLTQSQPNHVEVVVEKNTVAPICKSVCQDYALPMTSGRGYCSLPPRIDMAERFRKSGKEKLVLLIISDLDPDGEEIAHSLARSMRDDFSVKNIVPVKVALTRKQAERFDLPPSMKAKAGSATRAKFVQKYGEDVWELEALSPKALQNILRDAIESVLDMPAFYAEQKREQADAVEIEAMRSAVLKLFKTANLEGDVDE